MGWLTPGAYGLRGFFTQTRWAFLCGHGRIKNHSLVGRLMHKDRRA